MQDLFKRYMDGQFYKIKQNKQKENFVISVSVKILPNQTTWFFLNSYDSEMKFVSPESCNTSDCFSILIFPSDLYPAPLVSTLVNVGL